MNVRGLCWIAVWGCLVAGSSALVAAPPAAETLIPASTTMYISIPDPQKFQDRWNETELGKWMLDPAMQLFRTDLKRQFKEKQKLYRTLGLTWDDVREVARGEACFIYTRVDDYRPAQAMIVDVTGNLDGAQRVIAKAEATLAGLNAKRYASTIAGVKVTIYDVPPQPDMKPGDERKVYAVRDNLLVASQSLVVAKFILEALAGSETKRLASLASYKAVMTRCQADLVADQTLDARWFLDPFQYVAARRIQDPSLVPGKNERDRYQELVNTGFTAIQAMGGHIHLLQSQHDVVHRTKVYAPPPYTKSMLMMKFPNLGPFPPAAWVPADVASCLVTNVDVVNGFDHFGPYFDQTVGEGDEGVWKDVVDGLKDDPEGPRLDLRKELIQNLQDRAVVLTDYEKPIHPKSERRVIAVPAKDTAKVSDALARLMKGDRNVRERQVAGFKIYEMLEPEKKRPGSSPRRTKKPEEPVAPPAANRPVRNTLCVAHDHLFVATHVEFLVRVLNSGDGAEPLERRGDYQLAVREVDALRQKLSLGKLAGLMFTDTAADALPTFELMKQGKMGEAETLLARLLNRMFDLDHDDKTPRKQQIDASKLPPFDDVKHYFHPAGIGFVSEQDGWYLVGFLHGGGKPVASANAK